MLQPQQEAPGSARSTPRRASRRVAGAVPAAGTAPGLSPFLPQAATQSYVLTEPGDRPTHSSPDRRRPATTLWNLEGGARPLTQLQPSSGKLLCWRDSHAICNVSGQSPGLEMLLQSFSWLCFPE